MVAENPHLVQAEAEWFWKRDHEKKAEDEAGSSHVVKMESCDEGSDIDWDDLARESDGEESDESHDIDWEVVHRSRSQ